MKLEPTDQLLSRIDALLTSQNKHLLFERVMGLCDNPTQYAREIYWPEHILGNHEYDPEVDDPFVERTLENYMHGTPNNNNPFNCSYLTHDSNCVALCVACGERGTDSVTQLFCRSCDAMNEDERIERYSDPVSHGASSCFYTEFHQTNPDLPAPLSVSHVHSQPMVS